MTTDLLVDLGRVNLAAGAAIILILMLRAPVRRMFGARTAYGLWALAPLAALATLAPARMVLAEVAQAPDATTMAVLPDTLLNVPATPSPDLAGGFAWPDPSELALGLWLLGMAASLLWLAWRQWRFMQDVGRGVAGPAVVGVIRPRIIVPADFEDRFEPRERLVVLAHERLHLTRQDARVNALAALTRCINWFNPLIHIGVHHLRIDQELACDAQVIDRHPKARRSYAEAMVKAQFAARPLPLGCYWPASSVHPLAQRIDMLTRKRPGFVRRTAGAGLVSLLCLASGYAAWAAQPARIAPPMPAAAPAAPPIPVSALTPVAPAARIAQAIPTPTAAPSVTVSAAPIPAPAASPAPLAQEPSLIESPVIPAAPTPAIVAAPEAAPVAHQLAAAPQPQAVAPRSLLVRAEFQAPPRPAPAIAAETTRELDWTGGSRLIIAVPAEVRYTQGPRTSLVITGPRESVERIEVRGGKIQFDRRLRNPERVRIVMSAPDITDFSLSGTGTMTIDGLRQDQVAFHVSGAGDMRVRGAAGRVLAEVSGVGNVDLSGLSQNDVDVGISGSGGAVIAPRTSASVSVSGVGRVSGAGTARTVRISMSGSGAVDLGRVAADDVSIHTSGSGRVIAAPRVSADIQSSGSGSVQLVTNPQRLNSRMSGSGRLIQAPGAAPAPAVPPAPPRSRP